MTNFLLLHPGSQTDRALAGALDTASVPVISLLLVAAMFSVVMRSSSTEISLTSPAPAADNISPPVQFDIFWK